VTGAAGQVGAVLCLDNGEMLAKPLADSKRKQRDAVLLALGVPHEKVTSREVDVLDADPCALKKAQAGAVQKLGREARNTIHRRQHAMHLLLREHERHRWRPRGPHEAVDPRRFHQQNVAVQEVDRGKGLDVRGRTDTSTACQRIEKGSDIFGSELARMTAMERHESANPRRVRGACSRTEVARRECPFQQVAKREGRAETRRFWFHAPQSTG